MTTPRPTVPPSGAPRAERPAPGAGLARDGAFVAALAVAAALAALLPAVTQDPGYHRFIDRRLLAGVPNALNVLSNAAFALAGVAGLWWTLDPRALADRRARPAWLTLFGAVLATAAGSAWYHLEPDSARLVWDRLPMAVAFMALVAVLAGERFGAGAGRWLLPRLVLAGVASVWWWQAGDAAGGGNLLPYAAVQGGALLAVPVLLVRRPREAGPRAPWLAALGLYVAAKVLEVEDAAVFAIAGVSGHTLKHLAAAAAIGVLALELRRRARGYRPAARGACSSMLEKSFGGA